MNPYSQSSHFPPRHGDEIWLEPSCPFLVVPSQVMLTSGRGTGTSALNAFDCALLDARVGDLNLLKTTSIVPAGATVIDLSKQPTMLDIPPGAIVPAVYACFVSDAAGQIISACLAVGLPTTKTSGVIFEYAGPGGLLEVRPRVQSMVAEALKARRKPSYQVLYAVSELTVPDHGFGCVVALALLLRPFSK